MEQLAYNVSLYMDTWIVFVDVGLAWDFSCLCESVCVFCSSVQLLVEF